MSGNTRKTNSLATLSDPIHNLLIPRQIKQFQTLSMLRPILCRTMGSKLNSGSSR